MRAILSGVGEVTIEELESRFSAYMNAGAPKPVLGGPSEQQRAILQMIRDRGDGQMRSLMESYLRDPPSSS